MVKFTNICIDWYRITIMLTILHQVLIFISHLNIQLYVSWKKYQILLYIFSQALTLFLMVGKIKLPTAES